MMLTADYLLRHIDHSIIQRVTTREQAEELARQLDVDPGIVAGQAAHARDAWAQFSKLRKPLKLGS
jgi:hypothetical protein